jgi:dephospho-CoA kinase
MKVKRMYKIGVTGGIASGKTNLLKYLSTIPRIYTINLDLLGHDIYNLNPIIVRNVG